MSSGVVINIKKLRRIPLMYFVVALQVWGGIFNSSLILLVEARQNNNGYQHFDLIPSTIHAPHHRHRRDLMKTSNDTTTKLIMPEEWFHPNVRAVYATLHPTLNTNHTNNTARYKHDDSEYQDFVKYRHLSRFERHYRTSLGLGLQSQPMILASKRSNTTTTSTATTISHKTNQRRAFAEQPEALRGTATGSSAQASSLVFHQHNTEKFYQGIPLSQGYGTHYVHIWVGSPIPQRQSVIVDTGSHFTAFPCQGCHHCGQEHHTDPYFDPSKSETFVYLDNGGCQDCPMECTTTTAKNVWAKQQDRNNNNATSTTTTNHHPLPAAYCPLIQSYTEGSSWKAIQAKDGLYCGGTDILEAADPIDRKYSIPFVFGCLQESTGLFVTQLANGIMGLSAHERTLPKQLYNMGYLQHHLFALCFRKELKTSKRGVTAGSMTLGGVSSALDMTPMIYAKNIASFGWFTVHVRNVFMISPGSSHNNNSNMLLFDTKESTRNVRQIHIPNTSNKKNNDKDSGGATNGRINAGKGVIVDSGTTDTYLNAELFPAFSQFWKEVTGLEYTEGPQYLTKAQFAKLPTVLIQCEGAAASATTPMAQNGGQQPIVVGQVGMLDPKHSTDLLLAIPASHYMEYSPMLKLYTSRLYFTETKGGVLGANAMQGHNVVFDWQHGRIGFSQSTCDYDLLMGQNRKRQKLGTTTSGTKRTTTSDAMLFGRNDCVLEDRPVLTKKCQVDTSVCRASDNPDNISVMGLETWTWIVDSPPSFASGNNNDSGSCKDVLTEWTLRQHLDVDPSIVECAGDGICTEQRPCELPCLQAIADEREKQNASFRADSSTNSKLQNANNPTSSAISSSAAASTKDGEEEDDLNDLCGETLWSACDLACKQTRVWASRKEMSTTHPRSPIEETCVEVNRETRSCHVDACGQTDPCLVPFLVHTSLVLEGSSIQYADDSFRHEFTKVAHLPEFSSSLAAAKGLKRQRKYFEEGDIDVLVVRPWFKDDDDRLEGGAYYYDSNRNATSAGGGEEDDDPIGIQLILQISIFNPRAQRQLLASTGSKESSGGHQRYLLQELGVLWANMTALRPNALPKQQQIMTKTRCDVSDIYPLAQDAVEVAYGILANKRFGSRLVEDLDMYHSARVLSSWTISTEVVDDAPTSTSKTSFGVTNVSPATFFFRVLYEASLVFLYVSVLSCLFPLLSRQCRHFATMIRPHMWRVWNGLWSCCSACWRKRQYEYQAVSTTEENAVGHQDDDSLNDKIMGSPRKPSRRVVGMEIEMVHSHHSKKTTATKRKNPPTSPLPDL